MIQASRSDKKTVVDILTKSYEKNPSIAYIIKQDSKSRNRLRVFMEYSFETSLQFGAVFLSDDRKAAALIVFPDKQKTTFKSMWLCIRVLFYSVGIANIKNALNLMAYIDDFQPYTPGCYLSFIGVSPEFQKSGTGTKFLKDIIIFANSKKRSIYLETSVPNNVMWLQRLKFTIYNELDLGYKLYFLKYGSTASLEY